MEGRRELASVAFFENQGSFGGLIVCFLAPELSAEMEVELELVCLPAVRGRQQAGVEEGLEACKPGRGATLSTVER